MVRRRQPDVRPEDVREQIADMIGQEVLVQYKKRRRKRTMEGTISDVYPNFFVVKDRHGVSTSFSYVNVICDQVNVSVTGEEEDYIEFAGS